MSYGKSELLWWLDHPGFEKTEWWMRGTEVSGDQASDLNEEHPELLFIDREKGDGRPFDPAPIFWEALRRHPALSKLVKKLIGPELLKPLPEDSDGHMYEEAEYSEILRRVERQMDLSHDWQRSLFYLVTGHQRCWTNLESARQSRFRLTISSLIKFLRPNDSNSLALFHFCRNILPLSDQQKWLRIDNFRSR